MLNDSIKSPSVDRQQSSGSGSGPKTEEEKKAPSSDDSWQEAELTESIIQSTEQAKSSTSIHVERYLAKFEEKVEAEIAKVSQKYEK